MQPRHRSPHALVGLVAWWAEAMGGQQVGSSQGGLQQSQHALPAHAVPANIWYNPSS